MKKLQTFIPIILISMLSACSSPSDERYAHENDHHPDKIPPLGHVEDVNPRYEPHSTGGNKDYTVRGIDYQVWTDITELTEHGKASWYGNKFHGHLTSNGERYDMFTMSAAHKNLPLPSYVEVTSLKNNKKVIVRVNDRGPFHEGRVIDLSYAAAHRLDVLQDGTADVEVKLLHFPAEENEANQFNGEYFIQYLVTSQQTKADDLGEKLGDQHQVESLYLKEKELYKLRLGPLNSKYKAQQILAKMAEDFPGAYIIHNK